jgi:energy-coupling factor transport system substrate-specific component/cob(I)alamin adenosyltransferase
MNGDLDKKKFYKKGANAAKEIAFIAVFVALLIGSQFVFAAIPGVEIVTLLFVAYSFAFGVKRGMVCATAFAFVRQFVFGFFPNVLILYLIYYNVLALCLGVIGLNGKAERRWLAVTLAACVCTVGFSVLDFFLTAIIGGYSEQAKQIYFNLTLPVMVTQVVCVAVTVGVLFIPLCKIFSLIKNKLS